MVLTYFKTFSHDMEREVSVKVLVAQLCPILCDPVDRSPPGSSVRGILPGKNTGVGCHALLKGTFPTQGLNLVLLQWQAGSLLLSHEGSPHLYYRYDRIIPAQSWFYCKHSFPKIVNRC